MASTVIRPAGAESSRFSRFSRNTLMASTSERSFNSILHIGRKLRYRHQILRQGRAVDYGLSVTELIDVGIVVEACGSRSGGTTGAVGIDIDLPGDARVLQFLENGGHGEGRFRRGQRMRMPGRSGG